MNIINTPKSIAMDFDSNEVRIVEGKSSKKGITITKYCTIKIPNNIYEDGIIKDMEQLTYAIGDGLTLNKISKGNVHAVINSSRIILREVAFPKVETHDIANLIKYQLGDYVPIHPEDYVVKYINLGSFLDDGIEKLNILLIGVPKEIVENHLKLIKNIGLKPVVLDYKGNAICKLLSFGETINSRYEKGRTLGFIDLSYDNTGLSIIKDEFIKVSRLVEGGFGTLINNIKDRFDLFDEEAYEKILNIDDISQRISLINENYEIVEEVRKNIQEIMDRMEMIIRYYRSREIGNDIDLLLLHGTLSQVKGIEKNFADFFNVPCIKLQTISKLKFNGDLSKYASAIGGLIRVNEV